MTIKLYESDVYLQVHRCQVIKQIKEGEDIFIQLDKTLFFPEGGGQPCDLGTIGDANVLYVFEKEGEIWHKVDREIKLNEVVCQLNWERRFDHMQQHCGEHVLSGVFMREYGLSNKGFHLGEEEVTIDIDSIEVSSEMLRNVELLSNKAIYENRPIQILIANNNEEAKAYPIRKKSEIQKDIRIVNIEDTDCVACCGTHPQATGEIGLVKIVKTQKYKGMTRVFFKCGLRAYQDFQKEHDILMQLNRKYSSEMSTLLERIENETNKFVQLKEECRLLRTKLCQYEAKALLEDESQSLIGKIYENKTMTDMNQIAEEILEKRTVIVVLASYSEAKIILTHNTEKRMNVGQIFKEHIKLFQGKGGGNAYKAQGSFETIEQLEAFYQLLMRLLA